jgi:hypothetical protein
MIRFFKILLYLCAAVAMFSLLPPKQYAVAVSNSDIWVGYSQPKRICSCESQGDPDRAPRQFDAKGNLLLGEPDPMDVDACQISTRPKYGHAEEARKLGLDLFTYAGNIAYAKILYDREGESPWKWSKGRWR